MQQSLNLFLHAWRKGEKVSKNGGERNIIEFRVLSREHEHYGVAESCGSVQWIQCCSGWFVGVVECVWCWLIYARVGMCRHFAHA